MSPHRRTPKFGEKCPLARPLGLTMQKFCGDPTRTVRDIHEQKFVLPEKVVKNSPELLKTCCPLKSPIILNLIEIDEIILEKALQNFLHLQYFGS